MKLLNFAILKLTLCLVFGIIIGYHFDIALNRSLLSAIILLFAFGIANVLIRRHYSPYKWMGALIIVTAINIGVLTVTIHRELNFKNHYSRLQTVNIDSTYNVSLRIREVLKPGFYKDKYVIDILKINTTSVSGRALLNVEIDSTITQFKVDDILIASTNFKAMTPGLNPHQFDYQSYLQKKYIYHQLSVTNDELLKIQSKYHTLFGYASWLREGIIHNLSTYSFKADELDIIKALLLGQRRDISKDIYSSYTKAGAVHILAVSGLHVGIILLLLNALFNPLIYMKHGRTIKITAVVILLWGFAIVAGLSASVVRAVTMFSVVAIAMNLRRPTNIYNTLAISMFLLLLLKPMFLFDVGFQLSYLAVFAIVIIQPMLYGIWQPKLKVLDFFWKILSVTIAAQAGILPVSLYYFHQFPGLFFISNLVIIPALGFILGFGMVVIILSSLHILPSVLADLYGGLISLMNTFVRWISDQESFLFIDISFGFAQVIISYLLITLIIISLKRQTHKSVIVVLIAILGIQGFFIYKKSQSSSNTFIVFHKSRYTIIGMQYNKNLTLHHNLNDSILNNDKVITNYKVGAHIVDMSTDSILSLYQCNYKNILVIDSLGVYNVKRFRPHIVLLRNSPKLNLERLIDSLHPELIISDGSNYKSYQERWSRTCKAKKIPFHQTGKKGAYMYSF